MLKYNVLNKRLFNNTKNKIIIIILFVLIFIIFSYFNFSNSENNDLITDEAILNNNENKNDSKSDNLNINNNSKENKKIIVHVDGEVNTPGIVELEEGNRISNAIDKAGGITENANLKNINLAYLVEDGMKIYVPANTKEKGEISMDNYDENNLNINFTNENEDLLEELDYVTKESGGASLEAFSNKNSQKNINKKININTANQQDLEMLPGIGNATALKIIDYRNNNGRFDSIEDIKNVKGIGDSKFENIMNFIICE